MGVKDINWELLNPDPYSPESARGRWVEEDFGVCSGNHLQRAEHTRADSDPDTAQEASRLLPP